MWELSKELMLVLHGKCKYRIISVKKIWYNYVSLISITIIIEFLNTGLVVEALSKNNFLWTKKSILGRSVKTCKKFITGKFYNIIILLIHWAILVWIFYILLDIWIIFYYFTRTKVLDSLQGVMMGDKRIPNEIIVPEDAI